MHKYNRTPSQVLVGNYGLIFILLILDSFHFVFARLLYPHIAPELSVFYVLIIGTIEVGLYGLITRKIRWQILKDNIWFFLVLGLFIAGSTYINYASMGFIDPGTAALLNQSSTIFGVILGLLWLRESFKPLQFVGAAIALVGIVIFTFQAGDYLRIGSVLILFASLLYSSHAAITKKMGGHIDFINFFFFRLLSTSAFLFLTAAGTKSLAVPDLKTIGLLVLVASVDIGISRSLYYVVLRRMNISLMTVILTLSPVITVFWSFLLFKTLPGIQQLVGGSVVMAGVLLVALAREQLMKIKKVTEHP